MPAKKTTAKKVNKKTTASKVSVKPKKTAVKEQVKEKVTTPSKLQSFASLLSLKNLSGKIKMPSKTNFTWRRKYWGIVVGALLVVLVVYFALTKLVIAWVDMRPITFFQYYGQLDSKYGKDLKEQLISQKLVEDEAQRRHVVVTDQEVNSEINTIKQQSAGQGDFNQLLAAQGLTMDDLRYQVKLQLEIKKMFGQNITITDDQVNKYIQDNKDQFPTVDDNTKAQVKQQLEQQQLINNFQTWLQTQQQSSRVKRV